MSDPKNFVARWSRLKRVSAQERKRETTKGKRETALDKTSGASLEPAEAEQAVQSIPEITPARPFDPASLPPIESITDKTDIRAFLQSGVPAELTRSALRRVWATDPAIRDFIGIAENQWDFTDPTAMPGFGPLEATDDVRKLVAQAMGELGKLSPNEENSPGCLAQETPGGTVSAPQAPDEAQVSGIPGGDDHDRHAVFPVKEQSAAVDVATQHADAPEEDHKKIGRRSHGRALPQ